VVLATRAGAKAAPMIGAFLTVLGIGVGRVYLGVDYPSDVLGGNFVGAVCDPPNGWKLKL